MIRHNPYALHQRHASASDKQARVGEISHTMMTHRAKTPPNPKNNLRENRIVYLINTL